MNEIMIDLQGGAKAPLYEKIYEYIKNEIVDGKISRGEKLPSTRLLAKNLSVSRSTVELAYDQLLAEGYIEAEPYRGYFVCDIEALYQLEQRNHIQEKLQAGQSWQPGWKTEIKHGAGSSKQKEIDFSPYTIDTQNFPYNVWRKLHKNVLLDDREEILLSGDGQGDYELRVAIADYLHQARGVNCVAEQIIIGAGNEYLELLLTQVLGEKKTVLMDDPTYLQAYRTFSNMGYLVKNIPAEQGSMPIEAVRRENADVLYVMPSHQFPLGTVMPLKQRLELLKWASEKEGRYLIEDDHDSEYRYKGKPIPSLQSIDHEEKVIYLGTFSKSIAPSLRISYMVLPQHLLKNYQNFCGFYSTTVSKIQQEVLREFISGGYFERHLNKMRGIYKNKHDFLVSELKKRPWVENIAGDNAGLHVLVQVDTQMSEEELCERAAEQGIHLMGISEHYIHKPPVSKPVILLGYGKPDEKKILEGLNRLEQIILK
ncbi:PLP-dependent aminotransferase family protein [bacterium]|nr:PLP-dependent aminotransferase family protein [bacterium]